MSFYVRFLLALVWGMWSLSVFVFHWGTLTPPKIVETKEAHAVFIEKTKEQPLQHLILEGPPYSRGLKAGEMTKHLLFAQEKELTTMLHSIFPIRFLFSLFELFIIPVFHGIDAHIPADFLHEMYGVAQATAPEFDHYAEPYTRQLAYHGLHEVGQMMVDQYQDDRMENMGCTALLTPHKSSWLVGRNFDFEGGATLDEKKLLKWVFPDGKYAYVSVIWAGMVGAVTAVNEHGIYASINAAGSNDFARHGLPSTLLLTRVMDSSRNIDDALTLFRETRIMITEVFVVVSARENKAYRIEKSPTHTEIIELTAPSAITNHLISAFWQKDSTNVFRRDNLTSVFRETRGEELLKTFSQNSATPEADMVAFLRDKNAEGNTPLHWGNRRAIDPMIANHSVVFNGANETLYVSAGPHLLNEYVGYDLRASFKNRTPQFVGTIASDPLMSNERHLTYLQFNKKLQKLRRDNDLTILTELKQMIIRDPRLESVGWNEYLGSVARTTNDSSKAKYYYEKALSLLPPYKRDWDALERNLHEVH